MKIFKLTHIIKVIIGVSILVTMLIICGIIYANNKVNNILNYTLNEFESGSIILKYDTAELEIKNTDIYKFQYDEEDISIKYLFKEDMNWQSLIKIIKTGNCNKEIKEWITNQTDFYSNKEYITSDLELVNKPELKNIDYDKIEKLIKPSKVVDISACVSEKENSNTEVEKQYMEIANIKEWEIKSDNLVLDWNTVKDYITYKNNKLKINYEFLEKYVTSLEEKYNTVGKTHKLKINGEIIEVSGGTYGWEVDTEKTVLKLKKYFKKHKSTDNFLPVFSQKANSKNHSSFDIGKTYILVSIEDQHVYCYKNGRLVRESDCITGKKGIHDTPTGVWFVSELKPNGKYLVGDTYRTWVDHWYRLNNNGIGLHDADWQPGFGGSMYINRGSHGCINLPEQFAAWLEEFCFYGLPVIIY